MKLSFRCSISDYESGGIGRPLMLDDGEAAARREFAESYHQHDHRRICSCLPPSTISCSIFPEDRTRPRSISAFFCLSMAINTFNHQFPVFSGSFSHPGNPYLINYLTVIMAVTLLHDDRSGRCFPMNFPNMFSGSPRSLSAGIIILLLFVGFKTAEQMMKVYFIFMIIFIIYVYACSY